MAQLEDLPAELVIRVLFFTSPTDLDSLSQVNHRWYSLASKRLQIHRLYCSKFRSLHDGYVWRDVVINILKDPWIGHYIKHLSMNQKVRHRKGLLSSASLSVLTYEGDSDWNILREALVKSPFIQTEEQEAFQRTKPCRDESLPMAFLLVLLPSLQQLTMTVPSTWRGMKLIQKVVTRMAIAYHHRPDLEVGLSSLKHMEFKGLYRRGPRRANLSFVAPFIALPKASTIKIVNTGVQKFTSSLNLPLSTITSLILIYSPIDPQALSALLHRTPWLERFVYQGNGYETQYDITANLCAVAANVGQSLKFLALALEQPRNFGDKSEVVKIDYEKAMPNLYALYIHTNSSIYVECSNLATLTDIFLTERVPPRLQMLVVDGLQYCASSVKFIRELVTHTRCKQLRLQSPFISECESLDMQLIIETELLKATCSQSEVILAVKEEDFREKVVLGANERWRDCL